MGKVRNINVTIITFYLFFKCFFSEHVESQTLSDHYGILLREHCLLYRSQAARGKDGQEGVSEMGTRLEPVPGLPGGECATSYVSLC